jgi:hypothetical protein
MLYSRREWKLSHAGRNVFDYNSALELDYLRFRKLNTVQEDEDETPDPPPAKERVREDRTVVRVFSLPDISIDKITSQDSLPSLVHSVLPEVLTIRTPQKRTLKRTVTRTLSGQPIKPTLNPLRTNQYLSTKRQTLILEGSSEKKECTVTDFADGEVKFSCISRQDGVVCRSYKSMMDIVTVGREDNFIGIFRSIDGFKDGLLARVRKGSFGKVRYEVDLITPAEKTRIITSIAKEPIRKTAFVTPADPEVMKSLVVYKKAGSLKIRDKSSKVPIATLRRDGSSGKIAKYWLHIEPRVDSCFASVTAVYALRKKFFGDNLPDILRTQHALFSNEEKKVAPV